MKILPAILFSSLLLTGWAFAEEEFDINHKDVVTSVTGLRYHDSAIGSGKEAKKGNRVTVHYTGWIQNSDGKKGKKFDSSRDRGTPFAFPLGSGRVIAGWEEGVQGMKIGGRRTLFIPSGLAYGVRGAGKVIPPSTDLIFEIQLLGVN